MNALRQLAFLACVAGLAVLTAHPGWAQTRTEGAGAAVPTLAQLRDGFRHPPAEARLRCYWWWLNGNTDTATITHDLEEMKAKGFGGALLVDANGANQTGNRPVPAGPTFGSPAWVVLFRHALSEADRLGLEITFNITSGWNLGGPDVKPEQASKLLTFTRTQVKGGGAVRVALAAPEARNAFYRQIAVLAYPLGHGVALAEQPDDAQGDRHTEGEQATSGRGDAASKRALTTLRFRSAAAETGFSMPDATAMLNDGVHGAGAAFKGDPAYADAALEAVRDVTSRVDADGTLRWEVPAGDWEVLRVGYTDSGAMVSTASGAWQGLAIDYMSREAFLQYWSRTVEPLLTAARPYRSLRYLASDSWELGGTNWTDDFQEQFRRLRGYDPVPWLPVAAGRIVGDRSRSTRFLTDLRRTVADLIVSEHYDVFAAKSREHGMGVQAESGGPHGAPIDALETFRHAEVMQTEFWSQNAHRNTDVERFFTKEGASAANIYGKRFVAQEGETSIGPQWSESLATDLKPSFDMAVTEGMNRLVWHEFTSSPASSGVPGQEYFAGTHLNPKTTWWNAGEAFFTYLNRAQYMMQQGVAVDDVLYFYGDNVPNFVRLKADDPAHVLPGYDYDVVNEDALLRTIGMDDGRLKGPGGVEWKALALPKTDRVSVEVLRRVERYVGQGGLVIAPRPTSTTGMAGPQVEAEFTELVRKIWGEECVAGTHHAYGKGQVYCTHDARAVLGQMSVLPDVAVEPQGLPGTSTSDFDYVHRRVGNADVYFVRNGSDHVSSHEAVFRVKGGAVELWNGVDGTMSPAGAVSVLPDGRTRVPIVLQPFGSVFVVFGGDGGAAGGRADAVSARTLPLSLKRPWSVTFEAGRGAPSQATRVEEMRSWTEWPEAGVRFFSGTAVYRTTVSAPEVGRGEAIWLKFSDVREIARVRINGKDAGTVWAKPLMLRVDRALRAGENELEIQVTNLWPNRVIGDLQPGASERFTRTNITAYKADSPLLPSGLIGPVVWCIEKRVPSARRGGMRQ